MVAPLGRDGGCGGGVPTSLAGPVAGPYRHPCRASPADGVVAELLYGIGDQVAEGAELVRFEAE